MHLSMNTRPKAETRPNALHSVKAYLGSQSDHVNEVADRSQFGIGPEAA